MGDDDNKGDQVGLFLRAMVDREPGKRKVKPSKSALIDLSELDLGESSDDSDFHVDEAKLKEDDDISINSDPEDDEVEDDSNEDENSEADELNDNKLKSSDASGTKDSNLTVEELLLQAQEKYAEAQRAGIYRPKILVCAICLGDYSDDANEIVTCDGCHVSVHEGCYGISDTISVSSTVSSSSTEPWFCDACKAGVSNPSCELCPNLGYTIFKETEMGRWVHLVCALYIPGIAFSEVDKLSFPTLFEMSYNRYGAKSCSLCEDERYSRTGICIGCDAGMCRSHFHVTCAQREGLLSEVNHGEADQADPYYAHCKLHTDRELIRRRKRNWLALQMHMKQEELERLGESQKIQERLLRKLNKYREKYFFIKASRPTPWFPTQKMPRPLSTSASVFRSILHKTKLMGIETESHVPDSQSLGEIRKKWHVTPAFNVEFISYYLDRMSRFQDMKSKLNHLLKENDNLTKEEAELRANYNTLEKENKAIKMINSNLLNKALEIHDHLKGLAGRPLRLPPAIAALHNPSFVESEPLPVVNVIGLTNNGKEKRVITKAAAKMISYSLPPSPVNDDKKSSKLSKLKSSPLATSFVSSDASNCDTLSIHHCSVCNLTEDQHLLIQCDTCIQFYHLSCLDPPLTRMPKKTKQMGWQCSDCCKSSDSDKTPEVDTAAPRRLRRIIKEPAKFSPSVSKDKKLTAQERLSEDESPNKIPCDQQYDFLPSPPNCNLSIGISPKIKKEIRSPKCGIKRKLSSAAHTAKRIKSLTSELGTITKSAKKSSFPEIGTTAESPKKGSSEASVSPAPRKSTIAESSVSQSSKKSSIADLGSLSQAAKKGLASETVNSTQLSKKCSTSESSATQSSKKSTNSDSSASQLSKRGGVTSGSITLPQASTKPMDVSADSLPSASSLNSPHSESFPSADDDPTSPKKERKHREGGKKKKKDKDKDKEMDGGRKRKKHHHRDRHNLGEMASEFVSPFRIKIKPLPPRPNELGSMAAPLCTPNESNSDCEMMAPHTTSTTTAPPGYPPLPPGYTLTQPVMVTSTSAASSDLNSTNEISANRSSANPTSQLTTPIMAAVGNTPRQSVGRRKSDHGTEQFSKCDVCGETGGVTNTVMCDECLKAYHFNCLEPPLKKSPKKRGYSWFCEDCGNSGSNANDKQANDLAKIK